MQQCAQQLLRQLQMLHLSDCNASAQEMFLKRRIMPATLTTTLDWEKERKQMEEFRVHRINKAQNTRKVRGYVQGDKVIVQNVDKAARWVQKGEIIYQTKGVDSFMIRMEDGSSMIHHRCYI